MFLSKGRTTLTRSQRLLVYRSTHHKARPIVGIRREDPARIWERRCPLTPAAVEQLIREEGVEVLVQPCERRVFHIDEFIKAGAKPHKTLEPAHITLGIKETPLNELLTSWVPVPRLDGTISKFPRSHVMFSHTIKGQAYNMPLLAKFLWTKDSETGRHGYHPTLLDWELLTDSSGKRTVGFGWYAGVAGALEGLVSTAHLHLELGVASPFLSTPRPHTNNLPELRSSLKRIGETISAQGTPKSMGPFVITVTGCGQVSKGVLSILSELPLEYIKPSDLPGLVMNPGTPLNKIYIVHATQETYLARKDGMSLSRNDYYANPSEYVSNFHETIAPYTTLLINGVGWTHEFPRLMTNDQTIQALEKVMELRQTVQSNISNSNVDDANPVMMDVMKGRCQSIADISCDIGGGLEFLPRESSLSEPSFSYKPPSFPEHLPPLQIMSVDILPTAIPLDASQSFSNGILPYVRTLIRKYKPDRDFSARQSEVPVSDEVVEGLERAIIAFRGRLQGKHTWLKERVALARQKEAEERKAAEAAAIFSLATRLPQKRILLLGSGLVAGPAVDEICKNGNVQLILASDQPQRNAELCSKYENATAVTVTMSESEQVEELISKADVVISLLPVALHVQVAELCIKHRRHLVTASYISPAMKDLHERAKEADVLLLNEIGLDPGIDHCSALSLLNNLQNQSKRIISFTSFCGGLPAPEFADVPLRYKFSWSPKGVLLAALNDARFLLDGQEGQISSANLLKSNVKHLPVSDVLNLEGIPNRNSVSYLDTYDLSTAKGVKTIARGTLRYPGFCDLMYAFKKIGLLESKRTIRIKTWEDLPTRSMGRSLKSRSFDEASYYSALRDTVADTLLPEFQSSLKWLTSPDNGTLPAIPPIPLTPLDLFSILLAHKLRYEPHERDLVVLHHEVITSDASSIQRNEIHTSSLEVYGTEEHSAMAICVGIPVALAALRVLEGLPYTGVHGPTDPLLYNYILKRLADLGLQMKETTRPYVAWSTVEAKLIDTWTNRQLSSTSFVSR